jgi:transcriptional regulator GlxA family with amidase domain
MTPGKWIKQARLNAAFKDLLHPRTTSVAAVADRWGFNHKGRFSLEYQALFGESPKETLRKK